MVIKNSIAFVVLSGILIVSPSFAADPEQRLRELRTTIQPLIETHCLDCHSGDEPDAGLTLDHFDEPLDFLKGGDIWEKAIFRIQAGEMPPEDVSEMTKAEQETLVGWVKKSIDEYECGLTPNPGKVTLRRLNASEYRNTIRELLGGIDYTPAEKFPGDDVGYGFDNIGDVLTLPPLLMERYIIAAEKISQYAIETPPPAKIFESAHFGGDMVVDGKSGNGSNDLTLASTKTATVQEQIPFSGTYTFTITAGGDQVPPEPVRMELYVDKKMVKRISVPNDSDSPKEYVVRTRMRAGKRVIGIRFINDFYRKPENGRPKLDRNLVINHVAIYGRQAPRTRFVPSAKNEYHRAIVFETPGGAEDSRQVTTKVLRKIAFRAYRRPLESNEVERLVDLAMSVQEDGGSFEESIQIGLQAILISPQFLFRVEPPRPAGSDFDGYVELDQFELATRLSYFLWSSMPDAELFRAAAQNKLRDEGELRKQVVRMLKSGKSNEFVDNFASQWLTLRQLDEFEPDPALFPDWNDRIRRLAKFETLQFFRAVMQRDMPVTRLLDADFTYLNEELAGYYRIRGVKGNQFRPVSLKGTKRAGLLTQASVLAVTSNPTRTSPVKRGKWILENLLDNPPPPAPPNVPELKEKGQLIGNLRQRLEQHRADPACANCHKLMDPLGFAMENFDAIGLYRTKERGTPIDAAGELPDGTSINGAAELRGVLVKNHTEEFVECIVRKMLTYALGRGLEYYDKCAVDKIIANLKEDDYRFSTLLIEIIQSDPFQKKGTRDSA